MEKVKAWRSSRGNIFCSKSDAMADDIRGWLLNYEKDHNLNSFRVGEIIAENADAFAVFLNALRLTDGKGDKANG